MPPLDLWPKIDRNQLNPTWQLIYLTVISNLIICLLQYISMLKNAPQKQKAHTKTKNGQQSSSEKSLLFFPGEILNIFSQIPE